MGFFDTSDLLEARADTEELMKDACVVVRPGAKSVTDPATGKVTRASTQVYTGKCRFKQSQAQANTKVAGEHVFTEQGIRWDTPVGSGPFKVGDMVTSTASEMDEHLVGRVFRVEELFNQSQATAQRCRVVEVL
ncbi:DUF6093 family protein [Paenarthrobacter sp. OM7]|uniref:DUF6093 family protein n=1 Tax=Paenarthrobacter sp. OM7 TaxID=3041264 RepID=UPI0024683B91|nr:DUF6093 family protein [Paenarthrobacter sp. OM7]WGM21860.1 DUF6093 family protein [Paenarthrobacter sp. OM7]